MEERSTMSESSLIIMGKNNNCSSTTTTNPLDFARILKNLVILSTIVVAFIILYNSSSTNFGKSLPSFSSLNSELEVRVELNELELKKVLKAASTKENTVILTTLNEAWAKPNSIFDLFLGSFKTGNNTYWLLNHLLVIAVDDKAYIQCQKRVSHCYLLKTKESTKMAHAATFMTPIYVDMMWERLAFLQTILSLGYNFVFTDTDVMWFRNPFPHFIPDADFQTSCDDFNGNEFDIRNSPNNGFLYVRSNNRTIHFYKFWVASRRRYPHSNEQDVFNKIKNKAFVKQVGIKLRFLDTVYFGGFCQPSKDFNKVCTMHANCCIGMANKIADICTTINTWKTYLSSNHTTLQPSHWGVPNKCHV